MKQNFRTAPIQGHYDFDIQAMHEDGQGNTYLLVQIEKWELQFCTDCADEFVDAWCEVFKFDPQGQFVDHTNLKTTRAVVSSMNFEQLGDESITVQINDINAVDTKLLTTICRISPDLTIQDKFDMDEVYYLICEDVDGNLVTSRNIFDAEDPEIKGLSDVLVSKFDSDGNLLEQTYFGGSSWDFPRALSLTNDGAVYFLTNSESTDFDVTENFEGQDIWLVKLTEEGSTRVEGGLPGLSLSVFPNPTTDFVRFNLNEPLDISIYNMQGGLVLRKQKNTSQLMNISKLSVGEYVLRAITEDGIGYMTRIVKI